MSHLSRLTKNGHCVVNNPREIFDDFQKDIGVTKVSDYIIFENDVLFSNDTGILGKRNYEFSQQESNLQPSNYKFGRSTTELQETRN